MPQAAAARRTPATGARSGVRAGASGETAGLAGGLAASFMASLRRRHGRAVEGEGLDLRLAAQRLQLLADGFAGDLVGERLLAVLEGGRRRLAAVIDLDDVPAELRVHGRLRVFPLLQLEGGLGEFRQHLVLGEIAEIAARL